jgi:hypothetical protein
MVESLDTLPSVQGTTDPLPPIGAMGPPKSEIRTPENFLSEQGSSKSIRKLKKNKQTNKQTKNKNKKKQKTKHYLRKGL